MITRLIAGIAFVFVLVLGIGIFFFIPTTGESVYSSSTTLTLLNGSAEVRTAGKAEFAPAIDGMPLNSGATVRTGADAYAAVTFFEGSTLTLSPGTELEIVSLLQGRANLPSATAVALHLASGSVWAQLEQFASTASVFQIDTSSVAVLPRESLLWIAIDPESRAVEVQNYQGKATVRAQNRDVLLTPLTRTVVAVGEAPVPPALLAGPSERVHITIMGAVWARVVDPLGRTVGFVEPGLVVNQVPGSTLSLTAIRPLNIEFPVTESGLYQVVLEGTDQGPYRFVVEGFSGEERVVLEGVEGATIAGQRFLGSLNLTLRDAKLVSGQLGQFLALSRGAGPGKFVRAQRAVLGIALTATAVVAEGTATPIVTAVPTWTATLTATATATPTETATPPPTSGAPASLAGTPLPVGTTGPILAPTPPRQPTATGRSHRRPPLLRHSRRPRLLRG